MVPLLILARRLLQLTPRCCRLLQYPSLPVVLAVAISVAVAVAIAVAITVAVAISVSVTG